MTTLEQPVVDRVQHNGKADVPGERQGAFRALVEANKERLYYLALDLTGNHHDAEDLSQEVFIKAYRGLDRFRGDSKVHTWLYRIAVNTYLNRRRKKALAFMRLRDDFDGGAFAYEDGAPPDRSVDAGRVRQHIERALGCLSTRERSAFVLRHYHDLSLREVAAVMEVAEGTVKSMLFRAAKKMRDELSFYRDELGLS